MTTVQHNREVALDEPDASVDEPTADTGTNTADAPETSSEAVEGDDTNDELDAARLRGDSLFELLLTRSIEQATAGLLHDPSDLPRDGDLYDETGLPDLDKIRAAAEALTVSKPHLARIGGDVGQGVRAPAAQPSWSDIMREAMN